MRSHITSAWRALRNAKSLNVINIVGLAIGMTAAVLIFFWVANETNFDNYHKDAARIYRLTTKTTDGNWVWEGSAGLMASSAQRDVPGIEMTGRLFADNWPLIVVNGEPQFEKQCAYVDPSWFALFQYQFIAGNAKSFSQHIRSVILTTTTAKKVLGSKAAVGQTVRIDSADYEVAGVIADPPTNSSFQYHVYIPMAALMSNPRQKQNEENWSNGDFLTFVKVAPAVSVARLNTALTNTFQRDAHDDAHSIAISLLQLKDMHFESDLQGSKFVQGSLPVVYVFSILGFLLLLVACINYVNLTTAKASLRAKEVSIRKIIGAGRAQLFYQFLTETLLVSILSLSLTLLLIQGSLPYFNIITGKEFQVPLLSITLWKVLGSTLLAAFLLNSIYPALLLSSFKPLNIFRGITLLKVKDSTFRKGLVVTQFIISVVLITGTIVIFRQMQFVQKQNPGYNKAQVLTVTFPFFLHPENKSGLMQSIKQELLTDPHVQAVSLVNQSPINISSATSGVDWEGHDTSLNVKVNQLSTDADLQKVMQLQMTEGRWFTGDPATDRRSYILNETAVKELDIPTPVVGRRFTLHGQRGQILGVVKDFTYKSMHSKTGPLVLFNDANWWSFFEVQTTSGGAVPAVRSLQSAWKKLMPGVPLEYAFQDEEFDRLYKQDQLASMLVLTFAIIAVIISALGLFSLAAFEAERRTKELGIRKVLGATMSNIGLLLSKGFIRLVALSILIAGPIAWWAMEKWLQNFAYRISMSWWMLAVAGLLALVITLMITGYHTLRASLASPVKSLRTE